MSDSAWRRGIASRSLPFGFCAGAEALQRRVGRASAQWANSARPAQNHSGELSDGFHDAMAFCMRSASNHQQNQFATLHRPRVDTGCNTGAEHLPCGVTFALCSASHWRALAQLCRCEHRSAMLPFAVFFFIFFIFIIFVCFCLAMRIARTMEPFKEAAPPASRAPLRRFAAAGAESSGNPPNVRLTYHCMLALSVWWAQRGHLQRSLVWKHVCVRGDSYP